MMVSCNAVSDEALPIELLVLGSLHYLGCGWTFDDLEEQTAISRECHRQFFHIFLQFGSTTFFQKWVSLPTNEQIKDHMFEYMLAGQHGAVASSDATHVSMERCTF